MVIGIDLDGVLFDSESMYRSYGNIYNLKLNGRKVIDYDSLRLQDRFDWTKEEFSEVCEYCVREIQKNAPLMPNAKRVIEALNKRGHRLVVITSRGILSSEEIEITEKRLAEENLKFDNIVYCASDKLEVCKENNIDIMIDDLYDNVVHLAEGGINCLYYMDIARRLIKHERVIPVLDWGEIATEFVRLGAISAEDLF